MTQMRKNMKFDDVRSDTLRTRVSPTLKIALKADHAQRSMVNMLEVLVASFCDLKRIAIPDRAVARGHRAASRSHVKTAA